ncbi:hypothetical protein HY449_00070 [Candidatus Pacearchaeota archaeon]|nr:hypothetical protein [Candidatus Pacearchaeota archaeon]
MKITDLLLGIGSMTAGVLALINREFWPVGISLIVAGFLMLYFTENISKISENALEVKKLKEKLIIYERLSKIEAKVFR